ncbi:uncharacterized protein [Brachyistius frenatus]|uniref:uncharacterized protein n=1 Tax=Brachyistius frenatus TaxID=100188 RepID=UPI0037E80E7B
MFLVLVSVSTLFFGSSAGVEVCYGRDARIATVYTPPFYKGPLYFTPTGSGSRKIVAEDGKTKDPRLDISYGSLNLKDVTEKDNGSFFIIFDGEHPHEITNLRVLDCAQKIGRSYGTSFDYSIAKQAEFLEFMPLYSQDQIKILWNRTDPQTNIGSRVRVKKNFLKISELTQRDNGYYNFREKDNTMESRLHLVVEENTIDYYKKVDEHLYINFPSSKGTWTVTFMPLEERIPKTVLKAGQLVLKDNWFFERIKVGSSGLEIGPLESSDSGTFEVTDQDGNRGLTVNLAMRHDYISYYLPVIAGISIFGLLCYCFYKKKCCKRDKLAPQTAAPPSVYYHDVNQPIGPSYTATQPPSSFSYQPMNPPVFKEPTTTSLDPPVYHPVNVQVNPSRPEVAHQGGQGSAPAPSVGADFLSSGADPQFQLKGFAFASDPLSSDSTFCHVYNSDKLNFL